MAELVEVSPGVWANPAQPQPDDPNARPNPNFNDAPPRDEPETEPSTGGDNSGGDNSGGDNQ